MTLDHLIQDTLPRLAALLLAAAVMLRTGMFLWFLVVGHRGRLSPWKYVLAALGRSLVPLHRAGLRKIGYVIPRYVFHLGLFVIPIWYGGHIPVWAGLGLDWSWSALPDAWMDGLTLAVLSLSGWFLIRRLLGKRFGLKSGPKDYSLIVLAGLPFLTGYLLAHGGLDSVAFFKRNLILLHALSGAAFLVLAAFLSCRVRIDLAKCLGCAACLLACPVQALVAQEEAGRRNFQYQGYQCVACGSCLATCPEGAVSLGHELSLAGLWPARSGRELAALELAACENCGARFSPGRQLDRLDEVLGEEQPRLCPRCRQRNAAARLWPFD